MQHLGTRLLRTQRLVLRRMTLDDCHDMYKNWACDPAVTRYLRWECASRLDSDGRVFASC